MPKKVTMPRLDREMDENQIANWQVSEGDRVSKGDVLFEIETEKAAVEVEADGGGILHHIAFQNGDTVPVEATVAWLYAEDEEVGDAPVDSKAPRRAPPQSEAPSAAPKSATSGPRLQASEATQAKRILATPAARQAASDFGISLHDMMGTGPQGRIQISDIRMSRLKSDKVAPDTAAPVLRQDQPGSLSVITSGNGDRLPMVMFHGFLADASGWEKLAQPLAKSRRLHRIELPCHGRSPNRVPRDFASLAAEMRHALDALNTGPCHLVGHSLGGALALALADARPRKIKSLTLIAPAGLGPDINGDILSGMLRASRSESLGPWMKLLTSEPGAMGWSFVQAAAILRRDPDLRAAQTAMANALFPDMVQGFDLNAALHRVEMPTRIIWGRDDNVIPWKHALRAPGRVSVNLFDRTGHLPQYEVADEILPFLSELA